MQAFSLNTFHDNLLYTVVSKKKLTFRNRNYGRNYVIRVIIYGDYPTVITGIISGELRRDYVVITYELRCCQRNYK